MAAGDRLNPASASIHGEYLPGAEFIEQNTWRDVGGSDAPKYTNAGDYNSTMRNLYALMLRGGFRDMLEVKSVSDTTLVLRGAKFSTPAGIITIPETTVLSAGRSSNVTIALDTSIWTVVAVEYFEETAYFRNPWIVPLWYAYLDSGPGGMVWQKSGAGNYRVKDLRPGFSGAPGTWRGYHAAQVSETYGILPTPASRWSLSRALSQDALGSFGIRDGQALLVRQSDGEQDGFLVLNTDEEATIHMEGGFLRLDEAHDAYPVDRVLIVPDDRLVIVNFGPLGDPDAAGAWDSAPTGQDLLELYGKTRWTWPYRETGLLIGAFLSSLTAAGTPTVQVRKAGQAPAAYQYGAWTDGFKPTFVTAYAGTSPSARRFAYGDRLSVDVVLAGGGCTFLSGAAVFVKEI